MDYLKEVKEAAEEVLKVLGEGYEEKVYEEALAHELRIRKIPYERQRNFEIIYKGYKVGEGRADLILNPLWCNKSGEEIVLELKKVKKISDAHRRQAQVYMISLNINKGAILSFGDEIILEEVERPKRNINSSVTQAKKSNEPISSLLKRAANEVFEYFGVEFLYRETKEGKGSEIFSNAIGVELRLNGIEYSKATFPICYKNHKVADLSFNFVFPNGEVAQVSSYEDKEEVEENLEEFKYYLKLFNLKKGYLICFPSNEEDKVLVKEV
ncbi:MAG: GxxExxY protein [candidate division WOR-3 bacterium]